MIKLNLTLGNTFFEHFYLNYSEEFGPILPIISQHRIVMSERLIDYYLNCADKIGMKSLCESFIQNRVTSGEMSSFAVDCKKDTIVEELLAIAEKQPMKVLLAEKSEVKKAGKGINLYSLADIEKTKWCVLKLYSIPVTSRYVPQKKDVEPYKRWLQNWMKGEKKVIIRDKYLLEDAGMLTFKKHFLPLFEDGIEIEIHTDSIVTDSVLDEFDKADYNKAKISVFLCEKMHERVLIFESFQIVIGKGLLFLSGDWDLTAESFVSISEVTIDAKSTIIRRLR